MMRFIALVVVSLALTGCPKSESPRDSDAQDDDDSVTRKKKAKPCTTQKAVALANEGDEIVQLDPNGAIEKYEQAALEAPKSHRILFKLANAYKRKEEWDKMASTLARATDIAPTFASYWRLRGYALEQQAKSGAIGHVEALDVYTKCVEVDENLDGCHAGRARACVATERYQEALASLTLAVRAAPDQISHFEQLAALYITVGKPVEAKQVLDEALTFAKGRLAARLHERLGDLALFDGDATGAIPSFEAAKAADPENATSLFKLGLAHAELGKRAEAEQLLKGFVARACRSKKRDALQTAMCEVATAKIGELSGP